MKRRQIGFIKIICVKPKLVVSHVMCHLKNRKDNLSTEMQNIQKTLCENSDTTWYDHVGTFRWVPQPMFFFNWPQKYFEDMFSDIWTFIIYKQNPTVSWTSLKTLFVGKIGNWGTQFKFVLIILSFCWHDLASAKYSKDWFQKTYLL